MRKWLLVAALLIGSGTPAIAQNIGVSVNGEPVMFSGAQPQSIDGRVLVPLRGVLEKMGAFVDWTAATRTVTAQRGDTDIRLPVGSRTATVNGRPVALDVPAMILRGSTMVPLRFVGEAMGSEVVWDVYTRTVHITTSGSVSPAPTPTPTPGGISGISSFTHNASGWLKAGNTITVTLVGQAGGSAIFQIPGAVQQVQMAETSSGRYVGSWQVPANASLEIENASILGRLTAGGREMIIQAGQTVSIDTVAPKVSNPSPQPDTAAASAQPSIAVAFSDTGSGVNNSAVKLVLNDRDITSESTITSAFATYRPASPLQTGVHNAVVTIADRAGNTSNYSWKFMVQDVADIVKEFSFTPTGPLEPGDILVVSMVGLPGGKATFSIGEKVKDINMVEGAGGNYLGEYTVRRTDDLNGSPVTGVLTTSDGKRYTITANTRIGGASISAPTAPVISLPAQNANVASPLTIQGTASAGAMVTVRIEYTTDLIGAIPVSGTVGQQTVKANTEGKWQAGPFNLSLLIRGRNTEYTATATAENEAGETSGTARVVFKSD